MLFNNLFIKKFINFLDDNKTFTKIINVLFFNSSYNLPNKKPRKSFYVRNQNVNFHNTKKETKIFKHKKKPGYYFAQRFMYALFPTLVLFFSVIGVSCGFKKGDKYLTALFQKTRDYYFLTTSQILLTYFRSYRLNLIFSFKRFIPIIKTNEWMLYPESRFFFIFSCKFLPFILMRFRPFPFFWKSFYVWKFSPFYWSGPVWKTQAPKVFLFYFYFLNKLLSGQVKTGFFNNYLIIRPVNVGNTTDIITNWTIYYSLSFLRTPKDSESKDKLHFFFRRNAFFFFPKHRILPLPRFSSSFYTFKYAPHKSISTPIRAYE